MQNFQVMAAQLKENKVVAACLAVVVLALFILIFAHTGENGFQKTQQQVEMLASQVRSYYAQKPNYWGLSNAVALEKGIVPENMNRNGKIISALGKELFVGGDVQGNPVSIGSREFAISIADVGTAACRSLATAPLNDFFKLGLIRLTIKNNEQEQTFEWGGENPLPITKAKAVEICSKNNALSWFFE